MPVEPKECPAPIVDRHVAQRADREAIVRRDAFRQAPQRLRQLGRVEAVAVPPRRLGLRDRLEAARDLRGENAVSPTRAEEVTCAHHVHRRPLAFLEMAHL